MYYILQLGLIVEEDDDGNNIGNLAENNNIGSNVFDTASRYSADVTKNTVNLEKKRMNKINKFKAEKELKRKIMVCQ